MMPDWQNDLDLPHPYSKTRVVVAMSGGVDSSVVAVLLHRAGFDVVGITLQLYDQGTIKKGACCAGQDIYDARSVADQWGFPHYVLDYEMRFSRAVIDDFADSYLRGETPIPCIQCNNRIKFKDLLHVARDLGADAMATGHYIQRFKRGAWAELHRALDSQKDQSYFLFSTTQEQVDFLRFPLGGLTKEQVRSYARDFSLPVAEKPDSQDICFVPGGSYVDVLQKLRPGCAEAGVIRHQDGYVLGQHRGIVHYTIGQRRGLGLGGGPPLYVIRLNPEQNEVIVGPYTALACTSFNLRQVNWLAPVWPTSSQEVAVKIRSSQPAPVPAAVVLKADNRQAVVTLHVAEYGVSAGQACVFYRGSQILGGGWIRSTGDSPTTQGVADKG